MKAAFKIVVPVDFSDCSLNAAIYAAKLGAERNAEIILFHVLSSEAPPRAHSELIRKKLWELMEDFAKTQMSRFIRTIRRKSGTRAPMRFILSKGISVTEELLFFAAREKASLIVQGTSGASDVKRFFFGSNAASTLSSSKIPVITVPRGAQYKGWERILYASDLRHLKKELRVVTGMVGSDAAVDIVHISAKPAPETGRYQKQPGPRFRFHLLSEKNVSETIGRLGIKTKPDLLILFPHHNGFFDSLFGRSVSRKVALHSRIPLLTFK